MTPGRPTTRRRGHSSRRSRPGSARAPGVLIRPARQDDIRALAALMAASPLLQRYGTTPRAAARGLARGIRSGDRVIVAASPEGRPVGLAWILSSRILTGAAYLRLLLVAEGRQRTGVGSALMSATEAAARSVANHLVLFATTDNVSARRFYRRRGYRHVGTLPEVARPGIDEALYWKVLRPHRRRLPV